MCHAYSDVSLRAPAGSGMLVVLTDHLSRLRRLPTAYPAAEMPQEEDSDRLIDRVAVRRQRQRRLTTTDCQRAIETYLAGSSMNQAAAELHVHRTTIALRARMAGYASPETGE